MEDKNSIKLNKDNFVPEKIGQRCPVCNGFGTLNWGKIQCQACHGRGYILVPAKKEEHQK